MLRKMAWHRNTISSLGHTVPNRCQGELSLLLCASVLSSASSSSSSSMTVVVAKISVVARLVFIVDESLGIDPAVEFGEVAVPFHQSLRSSTHLAALQYRFHAVHFIDGYRHLLQLRFVEGAVQHFTEILGQSVHGRSEG